MDQGIYPVRHGVIRFACALDLPAVGSPDGRRPPTATAGRWRLKGPHDVERTVRRRTDRTDVIGDVGRRQRERRRMLALPVLWSWFGDMAGHRFWGVAVVGLGVAAKASVPGRGRSLPSLGAAAAVRGVSRGWIPLRSAPLYMRLVRSCAAAVRFGAVRARRFAAVVVNVPTLFPASRAVGPCALLFPPVSLLLVVVGALSFSPTPTSVRHVRRSSPAPPSPPSPPSTPACLPCPIRPQSQWRAPFLPWAVTARGPGRASHTRPCARIKSAPSHRWLRIFTRGWPSEPPTVPSDTYIHPSVGPHGAQPARSPCAREPTGVRACHCCGYLCKTSPFSL